VLIKEFEVDDDNLAHLAERGVSMGDSDAMLGSRITVIRNKGGRSGDYKFVGRGKGDRPLTIVVAGTSTAGRWRPITGWKSTDAERRTTR
jgi:hypothetical protein